MAVADPSPLPEPMVPLREIHKLTVAEYLRLADTEDPAWERTELIEGVVFDMTPQHARHAQTVSHLARGLLSAFPGDEVFVGASVQLSPSTLVEPDMAVVAGDAAYDLDWPVPAEAVRLVVEVSVNTLARDRGPKLVAYGQAGIPLYWIVDPDPAAPYLLCHADPCPVGYRRVRRIELPDGVDGLDLADALGS